MDSQAVAGDAAHLVEWRGERGVSSAQTRFLTKFGDTDAVFAEKKTGRAGT